MRVINLGCGKDIKEGWINVDKHPLPGVDVVHNLNSFPYPFPDNYVDYVLMKHVLEHLDNVIKVMEEVHRILKPNGIVEIIVPYYKAKDAYRDPTHKHWFTEDSMRYFEVDFPFSFYTKARFKILKTELYRDSFPFYHLKKYLGINLKLPIFPNRIRWIMKAIKGGD